MATFKAIVKNIRADGYYKVYIRVTQKTKLGYIPTDLMVHKNKVKKGEISDTAILAETYIMIKEFYEKLRFVRTESWSPEEIISFIKSSNEISFSKWCKNYYEKIYNEGRPGTAKNYKFALNHLHRFCEKENLMFSEITSQLLTGWLDSLKNTKRVKNTYLKCVKTMFSAGCDFYNDYDRNILRIVNQPFRKIKIPSNDVTEKRAIPIEILRSFFTFNTDCFRSASNRERSCAEVAKDVSFLIFCLCGINTADLYDLEKNCLSPDWILKYNRKKTRTRRPDKAYIEITVPEIIRSLFLKYQGKNKLLNFAETFSSQTNFNCAVNRGLRDICIKMKIEKFSTYAFRHSWATIAQNCCEASTEQVAFALNHSSSLRITEGYIKKDYSHIDILNQKVIEFVLNPEGTA